MGAYKVQAYPRGGGRLEGTSLKVFPPQKKSLKQGIWSSQFLTDPSQVVQRTPQDTPVPFFTRTSRAAFSGISGNLASIWVAKPLNHTRIVKQGGKDSLRTGFEDYTRAR